MQTASFLITSMAFDMPASTVDLLAYAVHAWSSPLESFGESMESFPLISPKPLIMFGTKFSLLNYQSLVCTTTSLNGLLAFFLTGELQVGLMASSPNLILSTLVYFRALLSCLFYSSSL